MCVIFYAKLCGQTILAKNRDKAYSPRVKIYHVLHNGIEIAYIKDNKGWIEGINEHGISVVNSTLIKYDKQPFTKRNFIFELLCLKDKAAILAKLHDIEGHTIVSIGEHEVYHCENNSVNMFVNRLKTHSVFSNHSIHFNYDKVHLPDDRHFRNSVHASPFKIVSSVLRRKLTELELKHTSKSASASSEFCRSNKLLVNVAKLLNQNYDVDPRFHPYRDPGLTRREWRKQTQTSKHATKTQSRRIISQVPLTKKLIRTTSQLVVNVSQLKLAYFPDKNNSIGNSKKIPYINKLPRNYEAKIQVITQETEKNTSTPKRSLMSPQELQKVYDHYGLK